MWNHSTFSAKRERLFSGAPPSDGGRNAAAFVEELRGLGVTPHVAQKKHSAIDGRTTRHAAYAVSIKKRKLAEEIFDLNRTIGGLRKARFVGLAKVRTQTVSTPRTTVCSASGHAAVLPCVRACRTAFAAAGLDMQDPESSVAFQACSRSN